MNTLHLTNHDVSHDLRIQCEPYILMHWNRPVAMRGMNLFFAPKPKGPLFLNIRNFLLEPELRRHPTAIDGKFERFEIDLWCISESACVCACVCEYVCVCLNVCM